MIQIILFLLLRNFRSSRTDSQMDFSCFYVGLITLLLTILFLFIYFSGFSRISLISLISLLSLSCLFSLSLLHFPSKLKQSLVIKSIEASSSLSTASAFCCLCLPLLAAQMRCNLSRQFSSTRSSPTFSLAISTSTSLIYISASSSCSSYTTSCIGCCLMFLRTASSSLGRETVLGQSAAETADFLSFLPKVRFWKGSVGSVVSREGCERCSLSMRAKFCSMISMSFIRSQLILQRCNSNHHYISINCLMLQEFAQTLIGWLQWNWWLVAAIFLFVPAVRFVYLLVITLIKQITPMPDLKGKYCSAAQDSWAVVTGATDGIGLGFCEVLTTLGFNVLLISRTPDKLKQTVEYLQTIRPAKYAESKLRSITFNFKDSADPAKWSALISQLSALDIALLVNNVGTSDMNQLERLPHEFIVDIININCVAMAALSAQVAKLMARRDQRSAIINLSSFLGQKAAPYITLYSATKAFNREFSNSLALECPFIDVMCLKPMFVESPLSKQKKGFGIPDRRQCAWDSLKELRWETETYGYFSHRLMGFLGRQLVPECLYRFLVGLSAKKIFRTLYPQAKIQ